MSNLHEGQSFFETLGEYILAGFKVAIIVAAMLIGFIALISRTERPVAQCCAACPSRASWATSSTLSHG